MAKAKKARPSEPKKKTKPKAAAAPPAAPKKAPEAPPKAPVAKVEVQAIKKTVELQKIAPPVRKIPVALQLYSVREECQKDFPGVLKAVAKMGYEGVEFAGTYDVKAVDLKKMLDDLGLKVAGSHIKLDSLLGDHFKPSVDFNRALGNKFLIVPSLQEERRRSRSAWVDTAQVFNDLAHRLSVEGMLTGYHNHDIEFTSMDGEIPWDTFFSNTRPEIIMQVDVGNALHGGADIIPCIQKYPGRALTVHAKEYSKANPHAIIGEGEVRWDTFFRLCETVGQTQWYIVEQESPDCPPLECVERCLKNMRAMGR